MSGVSDRARGLIRMAEILEAAPRAGVVMTAVRGANGNRRLIVETAGRAPLGRALSLDMDDADVAAVLTRAALVAARTIREDLAGAPGEAERRA